MTAPAVASPPGVFRPYDWTPDGRVLAAAFSLSAVSGGTVTDVDIVSFAPAGGTAPQFVVKTAAREGGGGLALSRDGRWLAYTSTVTGRDEIWVPPFGTRAPPVRVSPRGGLQPRWAPGGEELYYLESNRMMAVPVKNGPAFDFGPPQMLFEHVSLTARFVSYDVGSDGRFLMIAYSPLVGRSPINVIFNWTELLTTKTSR
jgi:hypothetical protein